MLITILVILVFLGIWLLLIYVRKSLWDTVHRNLLDLEDHFEGKVIRKSFLARPVFHGKINDVLLTLNFSTEKTANGRLTYIDISYDLSTKISLTISAQNWLDEQNAGEQEDFTTILNDHGTTFLVRPVSKPEIQQLLKQDIFKAFINEFNDLAYFFSGKTGILCEFKTDQIAVACELDRLKKRLDLIDGLARAIH
jgi:hypothetical protein